MNAPAPKIANQYSISVSPLEGRVRALRDGVTVAESNNAKVMYETRLAPIIYFPINDVRLELTEATGRRSFCPFKGTASYFDLEVEGEQIG
ncbi:MAG: DUF427 domain-containing protein, partial [Stappiaceae bacterium]